MACMHLAGYARVLARFSWRSGGRPGLSKTIAARRDRPYDCGTGSLTYSPNTFGARMRKISLPMRLALLVAGTMLPLIIFASVIITRGYQKDRVEASARVLATARSLRTVLDGEVLRMTGSLQLLALTNSLRAGDFDRFHGIASGFLDQYSPGGVLLVSDHDGRQLFSSLATDASLLPRRNNVEITRKVFDTGRPAYSKLFIGSVLNKPILTVEVPVSIGGRVVYVISFTPPIAMFQDMLEKQRPNADWTMSMFDAEASTSRGCRTRSRPSAAGIADPVRRDVQGTGSLARNGVAGGRSADHRSRALAGLGMDHRRRDRAGLAGLSAVARSRHHHRDRRAVAIDRDRLCASHGQRDRARRGAARAAGGRTQPPRQEYARGAAGDRQPDLPQRQQGRTRRLRRPARRAGPRA